MHSSRQVSKNYNNQTNKKEDSERTLLFVCSVHRKLLKYRKNSGIIQVLIYTKLTRPFMKINMEVINYG